MHGHCFTHCSLKYSRKMIGWFYLITCFLINRGSFFMLLLHIFWQVNNSKSLWPCCEQEYFEQVILIYFRTRIFRTVRESHFDPFCNSSKGPFDPFSYKNLSNSSKSSLWPIFEQVSFERFEKRANPKIQHVVHWCQCRSGPIFNFSFIIVIRFKHEQLFKKQND